MVTEVCVRTSPDDRMRKSEEGTDAPSAAPNAVRGNIASNKNAMIGMRMAIPRFGYLGAYEVNQRHAAKEPDK